MRPLPSLQFAVYPRVSCCPVRRIVGLAGFVCFPAACLSLASAGCYGPFSAAKHSVWLAEFW